MICCGSERSARSSWGKDSWILSSGSGGTGDPRDSHSRRTPGERRSSPINGESTMAVRATSRSDEEPRRGAGVDRRRFRRKSVSSSIVAGHRRDPAARSDRQPVPAAGRRDALSAPLRQAGSLVPAPLSGHPQTRAPDRSSGSWPTWIGAIRCRGDPRESHGPPATAMYRGMGRVDCRSLEESRDHAALSDGKPASAAASRRAWPCCRRTRP